MISVSRGEILDYIKRPIFYYYSNPKMRFPYGNIPEIKGVYFKMLEVILHYQVFHIIPCLAIKLVITMRGGHNTRVRKT